MVLEGHHGAVKCVAYSPDGKTLASTGDIHVAIIYAMPSAALRVCVCVCVCVCLNVISLRVCCHPRVRWHAETVANVKQDVQLYSKIAHCKCGDEPIERRQ